MAFSSTIFLFVFLPITLLLYYVSQREYRNLILLTASLIFYACGEPRIVFLMIASIICNYFLALAMERFTRRKLFLLLSIVYNLGILFVFKYLGFSMSLFNSIFHKDIPVLEIALPIGISFYTFQTMSYVIDVYNKKVTAEHNILNLGLYISLFPQLVAGPIVRYNYIAEQIKSRILSAELFGAGAKRFMCGFCKKVILANNLANVAEYYFGNPSTDNSVVGAWVGAVSFSLQIYYDFSGYSDMAIGLGKMLGFEFEENFNYPYISKSVTEFWRRWHISLSSWFRDYVYIPLGGSRVSVPRHILNMAIVWILTGFWHGADYAFIVWGFMYFLALTVEKYIIKPEKRKNKIFALVYRILVLAYVNFGWVIFNADGLRAGIRYCLSMIGVHYGNPVMDIQTIRMLREYGAFLLAGILFAMPVASWAAGRLAGSQSKQTGMSSAVAGSQTKHTGMSSVQEGSQSKQTGMPSALAGILSVSGKYILPFLYIVGFMWAVSYLVLGAHNPFVYFNF